MSTGEMLRVWALAFAAAGVLVTALSMLFMLVSLLLRDKDNP